MRRLVLAACLAAACLATAAQAADPHAHAAARTPLAAALADARMATARFVTSPARARAAGYTVTVTRHMPSMGWHFMNPKITGFDVTRPPILVYVKRGSSWQLGAAEWVFPQQPAKPPLPGATYGSFAAACHYVDGTFVPAAAEADCARRSPQTGKPFGFWHPDLVTMHLWLWYPNPDGLFAGRNPLVAAFDAA
jgi:hypothetical protein